MPGCLIGLYHLHIFPAVLSFSLIGIGNSISFARSFKGVVRTPMR